MIGKILLAPVAFCAAACVMFHVIIAAQAAIFWSPVILIGMACSGGRGSARCSDG